MKTSLIILLLNLLGYSGAMRANDDTYAEAMNRRIQTLYSSHSIPTLQDAVNSLERIGLAEKTKWEPYYYAAFGYIMMADQERESHKKDAYLDQAAATIKKAAAIKVNDSEITALEGFVHMIRVTVDPASRGQQYSGLAIQTFGRAISLDPENPRALALLAQMRYGTAQFLGSSTLEACSTNEAALQKFAAFKSENPLAPRWGQSMVEGLRAKCK
jgi:hypothetical protein